MGLLFVMCVLLLSTKMILAMTKLIIEWENTCVNKKPEVENDGEKYSSHKGRR